MSCLIRYVEVGHCVHCIATASIPDRNILYMQKHWTSCAVTDAGEVVA